MGVPSDMFSKFGLSDEYKEPIQPIAPEPDPSIKQPDYFGVLSPNPITSDKMKAADRYAQISRDQWEHYKSFGIPNENYLLAMRENPQMLERNLNDATRSAVVAGNVSASEARRGLRAYGVHQDRQQRETNDRLNDMATTANVAGARDYVRRAALERDKNILVGGAPNDGLTAI